MNAIDLDAGLQLHLNAKVADAQTLYPDCLKRILSLEAHYQAKESIEQWPGYEKTPLYSLAGLAARMGVQRVYYKDESSRFGLGSFKALGGAYAVSRLLLREIERQTGRHGLQAEDLRRPEFQQIIENITVCCATDGNHGRSVAWGAHNAGCRCVIYIHETVSKGREEAIARFGAKVLRVPGNYDDAVRKAAEDAAAFGYHVVSDTSYPGYIDIPKDVMQGYSIMVQEAMEQIGPQEPPTHIFIQGGVGGLAAAVCAHYWEKAGVTRPLIVVVEPDRADCLYQSALEGQPVAVQGKLDTVMAGLACGEVSLLAWDVLSRGASAFMTIRDEDALDVMRLLAEGFAGDPSIVAGESAVAGVAGCLQACTHEQWRKRLGLDRDSRVLFFASEGDTDPELYRDIVGRTAAEVRCGVQR